MKYTPGYLLAKAEGEECYYGSGEVKSVNLGKADTAPLAICLAALKAVGVSP